MENNEKNYNEAINYNKLQKAAKSCMRLASAITLGILMLPSTIMYMIFLYESGTFETVCIAVLWILTMLYIAIVPAVRYERYSYMINEEAIRVRRGFLWINEDIVPMERLHKIQVSQGPVARIFKLSTIKVTTAGGDVNIKFLKDEEAKQIAEALKKKINEIAILQRER